MPSPFEALVLSLAAYRITRLVILDTFPPVKWLRDQVLSRVKEEGAIADLVSCAWCSGAWISAGVLVGWLYEPRVLYVFAVFALSAVVGLLSLLEDDE